MISRIQESDFLGQVRSIHIQDILPINGQSYDVQDIIIEYEDKVLQLKHVPNGEFGSIHITIQKNEHTQLFGHRIQIEECDQITYDHSTYEDSELDSITFRWNKTWLHIFRLEYDLAITRSSFDLTADSGWPSKEGEPELNLI